MGEQDRAIPILPSRSLEDTVAFYGRLGFAGGIHPHGAYAILHRGTVELHFFLHRELVPSESSAGCYIRVTDVDRLHRELGSAGLPRAGIPRMDALADKPWGMREFAVIDPDGSLVRVGQKIES